MYRIIGSDGKQYGPVTLDQVGQWIAEGRVNARTQIQAAGSQAWSKANEIPEVNSLLEARSSAPGPSAPRPSGSVGPQQGLAITSFVLGVLSFVTCLLTGIPAIICGHIARRRARGEPAHYGGSGFALAGLILGYISLVVVPIVLLSGVVLPAFAQGRERARSIRCINNMKQIGLACRTWALAKGDEFPFNVSTNAGGTLELCATGSDGFDLNPALHFQVMSNELSTTKILVCPADRKRQPALDFLNLQSADVSYQVRTGTNLNESNPMGVLMVCPIHGHELRCDGSVHDGKKGR